LNLSGRTILVTGAAGFIGSHLADRLAGGSDLVLVDDFSTGQRENLSELEGTGNVRVVVADVRDRDRMRGLCEGVDVVFHLAASCLRTSSSQPFLSHEVDAGGTLGVCLAARDCGVERLVTVSSSEVYGTARSVPMAETHPLEPASVHGASKLAGERYALACHRTWGLPVTVVRPFDTYGPREPCQGARSGVIPRFILQLEAGRAPRVHGDGSQTRDLTYVDDTVRGLVLAAECDELVGDVVNVARGQEVSIQHLAELLAAVTGRRGTPAEHRARRPGDLDRQLADVSKARELLGFEPRVDLEKGLASTVEWFRASGISERVPLESAPDG
jgi:UDP-glucose 4-epimerase